MVTVRETERCSKAEALFYARWVEIVGPDGVLLNFIEDSV